MPITNTPPPVVGTKKTAATTRKSQTKKEERTDAIAGLGQLAQVPLIATRQYADVGALSVHWPNIAQEIANLAESQEQIAKVIDPLIKVGPYTALIAAVLPLAVQIAVNHGRVQAGAMGTVPANTLSAQVEAGLAQQEMQALQAQLEAEKAAQAMRDEIKLARRQMADSQASQATTVEND